MKSVEIDRTKPLREQPATGHNRLHPDIRPILEVDEGEEVVLETRDGCDGYLGPLRHCGQHRHDAHGRGPSAHRARAGQGGASRRRPRDRVVVDVLPQPHAFTAIVPGLGFLRDLYTTPYLVKWRIADGWATSPGAPRRSDTRRAVHGRDRPRARRTIRFARGPRASRPCSSAAGCHGAGCLRRRARQGEGGDAGGLHDLSPRERRATRTSSSSRRARGSPSRSPWRARCSGSGMATSRRATARPASPRSTGATAVVRFRVQKGAAVEAHRADPRFAHPDYFAPPMGRTAELHRDHGHADADDGVTGPEPHLACRNALLNMIELLKERGWTREQAYVIAASPPTCASATSSTCRTTSSPPSCPRRSSRGDLSSQGPHRPRSRPEHGLLGGGRRSTCLSALLGVAGRRPSRGWPGGGLRARPGSAAGAGGG